MPSSESSLVSIRKQLPSCSVRVPALKSLQTSIHGTGILKGRANLETRRGMTRLLQVCTAAYTLTPGSKQEGAEAAAVANDGVLFPSVVGLDGWVKDRTGTAGVHSSKMLAFRRLLESLPDSDKVVVFANRTSSLRLALDSIGGMRQRCVFLHGGVSSSRKREELFTQFRTDPSKTLLVMTLKFGSVGLNLTEASRVIFLEPWYSYASLLQGEARVHRIGQMRPVTVYYLLAKDTVEERVFSIAQEKKALATAVSSEAPDTERERVGVEAMQLILGVE